MAKKVDDAKSIEKEVVVKKELKQYPLKKAIKIGDEIKPIGYKISLTKEGFEFYKQRNII